MTYPKKPVANNTKKNISNYCLFGIIMMIILSHIIILIGTALIPLTRLTILPRRTHAIIIILLIIGLVLLTITTKQRRSKLISPLIVLIGLIIWQLLTNQSITLIIVSLSIFFLMMTILIMAQSEKSASLEPSLWRIINASERPLRRLTSLIIVSGVVFGGINLSRNCEKLWEQRSLFPIATDIDTALTQPDYIVDGFPRPSTGQIEQTKWERLIQRVENTWDSTKTTATNIVVTPQKMVFLSLCNASLNLRSGLWNQRRFQGGLIIVGTLLLVSILDIPLLIIMGIARLFLSLLDQTKLLPKHRRTIEVEQRGNKE